MNVSPAPAWMPAAWWPTMEYATGEALAGRSRASRASVIGRDAGDGRSCVPTTIQAIKPPTTSAWMATVSNVAIFCWEILSPCVPEAGKIFKFCYFYTQ
ncbi:MAG: hypothetical protein PWQ30_1597 [Euryarchaeota archaeon]|nr:hypothetical protein [Euryarchaeota archaeon]